MTESQLPLAPLSLYGSDLVNLEDSSCDFFTENDLLQTTSLQFDQIDADMCSLLDANLLTQMNIQQYDALKSLPVFSPQELDDLMEWSLADFIVTESAPSPVQTTNYTAVFQSQTIIQPPEQIIISLKKRSLPPTSTSTSCSPSNHKEKPRVRCNKDKSQAAVQRKAHNVVEKRYRENLKSKFSALEKVMCGNRSLSPAVPLRKSNILANAIRYMEDMQAKNSELERELKIMGGKMLSTLV
ncbi:hypothetical protein BJX63DRAFT_438282 [Aspergillus granulosus]|uniref:BHLH domain-containing protein n=1 Tax=Aspergillus granulosus TaxID=176169 RepID=A0ABR4GSF5_9EURO